MLDESRESRGSRRACRKRSLLGGRPTWQRWCEGEPGVLASVRHQVGSVPTQQSALGYSRALTTSESKPYKFRYRLGGRRARMVFRLYGARIIVSESKM